MLYNFEINYEKCYLNIVIRDCVNSSLQNGSAENLMLNEGNRTMVDAENVRFAQIAVAKIWQRFRRSVLI